jgi:hypothetical protein
MSNPEIHHFYDRDRHGDDIHSVVITERGGRRGYIAYLDSDDGQVAVYGDGDTVLSAIADLNRELELVE